MHSTAFREQFTNVVDACALAQGIVDTVREPVLVLDKELRVVAASRSFYSAFKVSPENTQGRHLYELGDNGTFQNFGHYSKKSYPSTA